MAQKPSIPKGTRDFSPAEMSRRNYIFDEIRRTFRLHGFRQIETPAMENLSTLMGKYGEEGDKLLFKVLNSGDFMRGVDVSEIGEMSPGKLASAICEKGLRYDLTVPFARFVVMHRNELQMPFKRYQIQSVWRADRPQRGRYREFFQCDADIVGSDSLVNEAELLRMLDGVFTRLGIRVTIKLNNRKILAGMAEVIGHPESLIDITVAIDKIDKIGREAVCDELRQKGLPEEAVERLLPFLDITGSTEERLQRLEDALGGNEQGLLGVEELRTVLKLTGDGLKTAEVELDTSLARGLNYYTGTIIEVKARDVEIGSISGGGRYDNLTGVFGMPGLSGVGVSFGADRIYDVLTALNLFPEGIDSTARVLVANMGGDETLAAIGLADRLRDAGIAVETYPDAAKLKKQLKYADDLRIPYVAIIGADEAAAGKVTLKSMTEGTQATMTTEEVIETIQL